MHMQEALPENYSDTDTISNLFLHYEKLQNCASHFLSIKMFPFYCSKYCSFYDG